MLANNASSFSPDAPARFFQTGRLNRPWADHVDANLPFLEIGGERARERSQRSLGGAIDAVVSQPLRTNHRRTQDNRRAVAKERQRFLHAEQRPLDVYVEVAIEFLLSDLAQALIGGDPGVGKQDVQVLLLLFDGRHDAVEIGGLGSVAYDAGDVLADRAHCLIELFLPSRGDEYVRAVGDELLRGGKADTSATAGDECHFIGQRAHGEILRLGRLLALSPGRINRRSVAANCLKSGKRGRTEIWRPEEAYDE